MDALVGHSGFVGSTLLRQRSFDRLFRSTDIGEIDGGRFDLCVWTAAPAQKWIANKDPENDRKTLEGIIAHVNRVEAATFVLISTVDVFKDPQGVDERSPVVEEGLHAYGLHRRWLEKAVSARFRRHLIVRLPGLVGPGLRKNAIYDLRHDNNVKAIDSRGVFQFYPMVNLWADIEIALAKGLELVHLTAEPLAMSDVASKGFGRPFEQHTVPTPARYDLQTCHAAEFGRSGRYQYDARESLTAIRAYAQSEPAK